MSEQQEPTMGLLERWKGRSSCLIGSHDWHRSRFVALNARVANLVCDRCHKQKED